MIFKAVLGVFKKGLTKAKQALGEITHFLSGQRAIDETFLQELENRLLSWDLGVDMVDFFLQDVRERAKRGQVRKASDLLPFLQKTLIENLQGESSPYQVRPPGEVTVYMIVGVNGTGKTTSVAKLAHFFQKQGKSLLIAGADTFRAAAIDQLRLWCERLQVDFVTHQPGADPGAVVFDALTSATAHKKDIVLIDVAGRLHTKTLLMEELKKILRIIQKKVNREPDEVLLTLDATVGQNGLQQARIFQETTRVSGLILTKLDGTARGGIVFSIKKNLGIPVKFIGFGETLEDLDVFDPGTFVQELHLAPTVQRENRTDS